VSIAPSQDGGFSFLLNNREMPSFHQKIEQFLNRVRSRLPILEHYHLQISSHNTFPHSSGIASSASAMSALAFCLADLQQQVNELNDIEISHVSSMARLGSGSAARSVYGGWNLWGRLTEIPESSDNYAIPVSVDIAPVFHSLHDDILIVDTSTKPVSSSLGHSLMDNHPFKEGRVKQATKNTLELLNHLSSGNMNGFIEITETEALSLHGLMMSSSPAFTLLLPNTLALIEKIKHFRKRKDIPVTFTLDAGPNLHLLYPDEYANEIETWEDEHLRSLCEKGIIIRDRIGLGPKKIIEA
jgi:diphosphomevalonate decarboxylase